MFCKYCGKQVEEGSRFCGYCGKEVGSGVTKNPEQRGTKTKYEKEALTFGTSNVQTNRKWSKRMKKPVQKARLNIGHIGVLLANILFSISLFLPNTGENKLYEVADGVVEEIGLHIPETTMVKPIVGNLIARVQSMSIMDGIDTAGVAEMKDFMTIFFFIFALAMPVCMCLDICCFRYQNKSYIFSSVIYVILAGVIVYFCHGGRLEMHGAGYMLLVGSVALMFVSGGVADMISHNEMSQRKNTEGDY